MRKFLSITAFVFFVFLGIVLIENYGINHKTEFIIRDTCKLDTVIIDSTK